MNTLNGQGEKKKPTTRREKWRHAFAVGKEYEERLSDEDEKVIDAFARAIVKRGLAAPALMWFITFRPLNFIGASIMQAGQFLFKDLPLELFIRQSFMPTFEHGAFVQAMEKRKGIDRLIELIEKHEDEARVAKAKARKEKKKADAEREQSP